MKMEDYAFVRVFGDNHLIIGLESKRNNEGVADEDGYCVAILGQVYGRQGIPDGSLIHTSAVKTSTEDSAVTYSGSQYKLGEMNSDYREFQKALNNGVPILTNWSIGNLPNERVYISGMINGKMIRKGVVAQDGSILSFNDGTKAFVDWISVDGMQLAYLKRLGVNLGTIKGRTFCKIGFQVDILGSDWSLAATAIPLTLEAAKFDGLI